jgi:hypothetical protein
MLVKITKCTGDFYWYKNYVGAIIAVDDKPDTRNSGDYRVIGDVSSRGWITQQDCRPLKPEEARGMLSGPAARRKTARLLR